jgi:MFS family permease
VEHYEPPPNGFRTFLVVWATQSLSVVGNGIAFFATIIWLTQTQFPNPDQKAELGLAISLISLAAAIPIVFCAPLAGAWVDRHDRKLTMVFADIASGAMSLLAATLMFTGTLELWMLAGITVANATLNSFHTAAFDTSYAMLVHDSKLPRANGMMQTIYPFSLIIAPTLAAAIISLPSLARQGVITGPLGEWLSAFVDGTPLALTLDAITFLAMGLILVFLHIPSPKRDDLYNSAGKRKSIWADVREGASYILQRRSMLWLLGTFAFANLASSGFGVYTPLIVKFNLVEDWTTQGLTFESALALLGAAAGVGELLGGIFISAWGGLKKGRVYGVLVPMIVSGVAQVIFGLSSLVYVTAAMYFIHVATYPIMGAHSQTIWQSQTPRALQGRVFAVRRMLAQFTRPASVLVAGITGGMFNPGTAMAVMGAVFVVFCVFQLFNPYLVRIEEPSTSAATSPAT